MQYCTRNPAIKKPGLSDAASIIDINDNMDVIDSIICKNNFNGATDPGVGDDIVDGYSVGSNWWNVTDHRLFVAESVATGAAVWRRVYPMNGYIDGPIEITASPVDTVDRYIRVGTYMRLINTYYGSDNYLAFNTVLSTSSATANKFIPVYNPGSGFLLKGSFLNSISFYGIDWGNSSAEKELVDFTEILRLEPNGNIWVNGDVNCASVTDHTPAYEGDAVAEIKAIKSTKNGMIDHASLPKFCQKKYLDKDGDEQIGRDLGATISILVEAIKQLTARIEKLENK